MRNAPLAWGMGVLLLATGVPAQELPEPAGQPHIRPIDVFALEYAADPQISPDGSQVVYVRTSFDIMSDRQRSSLWMVAIDGLDHRPLTTGAGSEVSPRWSPDGSRLAYVAAEEGSAEIWMRWMDTGQTTRLTNLRRSPGELSWSPDGQWIAFNLFVPRAPQPFASMPDKPEGADWGPPIEVVEKLQYRSDGSGYLEDGHTQVFVLPATGGTPRQLTSGPYNHDGVPRWSADGRFLIVSANRHDGWELEARNTEIYEVSVANGSIRPLSDRVGPDGSPAISPDGSTIAYLGFDDRYQGYQLTRLYLMDRGGGEGRLVTGSLERDVQNPTWSPDGRGLYFQFDDEGNTKLGYVGRDGEVQVFAGDVGGLSLGRPYAGGAFSVSSNGWIAFTHTRPDHPADVAVTRRGSSEAHRLTHLNEDLLGHKELGEVEEIWFQSSYDGREIQGWIVKPPGFDPSRSYPLILEIHGGPFANYGDRFSTEVQLYAAAGYVVFYANPRGSTSYGEEFGNLIHHAYPSQDYDDLMSGVDAVVGRGYVDESNLFVTGGSGGGVLTSWIVGKTDRFRAAVVAKPVINWYSFVLTADNTGFFYRYWFPGYPWDHPDHYMERSPLSLVGNVTTPTMLLTGEEDYRTPMSETEQYYTALKLLGVPTAMVRIPDASHGITSKPSNLVAKVVHILEWFRRFRSGKADPGGVG